MKKFRLWLMAHGIEVSSGRPGGTPSRGARFVLYRGFSITINHRFYGVDLMIFPFKGVFEDELNTPHAEIAAQYKEQK